MMDENLVCSFKIDVSIFKSFLKYVKSVGIDSSGSKIILIRDCILRLDKEQGKMWAIVTDEHRNLVIQIKVLVKNIRNPTNIPIEIEEIEKWLKSFNNDDTIKIYYENRTIGLQSVVKKDFLDFSLNTRVSLHTMREDSISNDLISNLEYGDYIDYDNLKTIKLFENSIYREKNDEIELFFGAKLTNSMELSSNQLKQIIADGERIGNREYPFHFNEIKLTVTIKSTDILIKEVISRDLYSTKYNVKEPFTITFSNRLTNAVNNISGYVILYAEKELPMLIKPLACIEKGIELVYLITTKK